MSAQALRVALTLEGGLELCRAVVREACIAALGKLRTEKNMIEEIKQASAPPKLAHRDGFGQIDLAPDAAFGDKRSRVKL